jgi:hypothetical protein
MDNARHLEMIREITKGMDKPDALRLACNLVGGVLPCHKDSGPYEPALQTVVNDIRMGARVAPWNIMRIRDDLGYIWRRNIEAIKAGKAAGPYALWPDLVCELLGAFWDMLSDRVKPEDAVVKVAECVIATMSANKASEQRISDEMGWQLLLCNRAAN